MTHRLVLPVCADEEVPLNHMVGLVPSLYFDVLVVCVDVLDGQLSGHVGHVVSHLFSTSVEGNRRRLPVGRRAFSKVGGSSVEETVNLETGGCIHFRGW
ncbi:hypothetical protein MRX96_028213 [Rhipicephalus microplus]